MKRRKIRNAKISSTLFSSDCPSLVNLNDSEDVSNNDLLDTDILNAKSTLSLIVTSDAKQSYTTVSTVDEMNSLENVKVGDIVHVKLSTVTKVLNTVLNLQFSDLYLRHNETKVWTEAYNYARTLFPSGSYDLVTIYFSNAPYRIIFLLNEGFKIYFPVTTYLAYSVFTGSEIGNEITVVELTLSSNGTLGSTVTKIEYNSEVDSKLKNMINNLFWFTTGQNVDDYYEYLIINSSDLNKSFSFIKLPNAAIKSDVITALSISGTKLTITKGDDTTEEQTLPGATVVQATGTSITDVMSQKAITDVLVTKADHGYTGTDTIKTLKQVDTQVQALDFLVRSNQWYGISWDSTIANPKCTRIGNMMLHATLPIQSKIRRCLLKDDGSVNYYLDSSDSSKKEDGTNAILDGTDGQVMVEIPDMYVRFEMDNTQRRCLMSTEELPGFIKWPKDYVSAYEATVERATNKLASVVNTTAAYRGGGNQTDWDALSKSVLGRPVTYISLTTFRTYARNRGSINWNCNTYQIQRKLFWLFAVEYANFISQDAYNAALTVEGYKQGGLSDGVTTLDLTKWSNFNGVCPFVPCGYTNSLGNKTGVVSFTMPFEYDSNGSANYIGEYNAATAYVAGNYVSSGTSLYVCILASTGNAVTNTTYFTPVTRKTVNVPSYRGVENPFGHAWKWTDGCKCMIQSDASGGISEFYVCDTPANFTSSGTTNYQLRGNLPRVEGYVKEVILGEYGEIMPLSVGGSSTTYFCDYFYTSKPASGIDETGVQFGGAANYSARAGLACAWANSAPSYSATSVGSRLCYIPV